VFLFKDQTAKLGDLNVSKVTKKGLGYTQTGTPYYASPEVWNDKPYDAKSDIWSLGCVLYEMIMLKPPFQAADMEGLYKKVLKGSYKRIPPNYSHTLAGVVRMLLQVQANIRPTCGNVFSYILDQVLKLPAVLNRIEKILPESKVDDIDESVLLSTIKVPNNLMYLTERLPKPNYNRSKSQNPHRNTMIEGALPEIRRNKFFRAQNDDLYKDPINIVRVKKFQKPAYKQPTNENKSNEYEEDFEDDDNSPTKPVIDPFKVPSKQQNAPNKRKKQNFIIPKNLLYEKDYIPFVKKLLHNPNDNTDILSNKGKPRQVSFIPRRANNIDIQRLIQKQDHDFSPYLGFRRVLKQRFAYEKERRLKPLRNKFNPANVIIEGLKIQ